MAILPILRWPDPRLGQRCGSAVIGVDLDRLAQDLLDTMYHARGRGLAAPQVGAMVRLFVMDAGWKLGRPEPRLFVNPDILWMSDAREEGPEGCLSIPGIGASVWRASAIRLRWTDPDGSEREEDMTGFAAICAQHEIDHLDGIVMLDRLTPAARAAALTEYST